MAETGKLMPIDYFSASAAARADISIRTVAPRMMSSCRKGWSAPLVRDPSTKIPRMYFASGDAAGASRTKSFPFSRWIVTFLKTGDPH